MSKYEGNISGLLRSMALHRKKGDALRRRAVEYRKDGRYDEATALDSDAHEEYEIGVQEADDYLAGVEKRHPKDTDLDMAELYGSRGGLLSRLTRLADAAASYAIGAEYEKSADAASTYNRINAIKLGLLTGERSLSELENDLVGAEQTMERRLERDQQAGDDGWLWADLGDVRVLHGDVRGAETAYVIFTRKAKSGSSKRTLTVLQDIVAALNSNQDPLATQVEQSVLHITPLLAQ